MLHNVEGFVIRSTDYGEGHKILTLFTRELGKISVMARGAKKLKSRFAAASQMFTYGRFAFYRSGRMGTLNYADILNAHQRLREDLPKAAFSAYIAEMLDRSLEEEEKSDFLFEQLKAALDALEEHKDPQAVVHLMELKALAHAGYAPQLDVCAICGGSAAPGPLFFVPAAGGVVCSRCAARHPHAEAMSEPVWKLLRVFMRTDIRQLGKVDLKRETKLHLKRIMDGYMEAHLGSSGWKAKKFLEQMDKYDL